MSIRTRAAVTACLAAAGTAVLAPAPAGAVSPDIVVSQVYGGGGNSGATLTNDYIELVNHGGAPVDLTGWSVQYASAAGTSWQVTPLVGVLASGASYLVAEGAGTGGSTPLPTPDATGSISMAAGSGKVALVSATTPLACGTACHAAAGVVDFVGYGSANDAETAPAPALSNTTAALRAGGGTVDTDNNAADFTAGTPNPRGSGGSGQPPAGDPVAVHTIQGAAHRSPLTGSTVRTTGVVTAVGGQGFWIADPAPDADPATSEGLYVYTGGAPKVAVADAVTVGGKVAEYRPGGDAGNLSTTELTSPTVTVTGSGAPLPAPVLLGPGGLTVPAAVRADAPGDVEAATAFDPATNALDCYESLEGMLVRVVDAVAVGPTTSHGELAVLPGGAGSPRTARGGIRYTYADPNTERVILDDVLAPLPAANVGDTLPGPVDVGSSRVDLQACKLEYSIVSPK